MLKLLLIVAVLAVAGWLWMGRRRPPGGPPVEPKSPSKPAAAAAPEPMLACACCGVHLPKADALLDAGGKPYCSPAHRLQGPR